MIRCLAFLHWLRPGTVRQLPRYYQGTMTSCRPSRRASFPSLGGTLGALALFAPRRTSTPPRPGVVHPVSPAGNLPRRRQDLPSSWGTPIVRLHMFFDSGRTAGTRPLASTQRGPRIENNEGSLQLSISELNSMAFGLAVYASQDWLPSTTQDSLPAAGQALPDGLSTRRVPSKGFKAVSLHLIPLSQAWLGAIPRTRRRRF